MAAAGEATWAAGEWGERSPTRGIICLPSWYGEESIAAENHCWVTAPGTVCICRKQIWFALWQRGWFLMLNLRAHLNYSQAFGSTWTSSAGIVCVLHPPVEQQSVKGSAQKALLCVCNFWCLLLVLAWRACNQQFSLGLTSTETAGVWRPTK